MKLQRWNWDKQQLEVVDADPVLIETFINWLCTTKRWEEDVEYCQKKLRDFRRELFAGAKPFVDALPPNPPAKQKAEQRTHRATSR